MDESVPLYPRRAPCLGEQVVLAFSSMLLAAVLATGSVDVRSATNCPSSEDVAARLLQLLPPASVGPPEGQDVAWISVVDVNQGGATALSLRLVKADASVTGARRLVMQGTCQDMAEAVATVIAAWETRPLPGAAPVDGTQVEPRQGPLVARAKTATSSPWQVEVGAGAGAVLVGGIATMGAIDIRVGRAASRWQMRLGVTDETSRQLDLPPGHVDWKHTGATVGLCWRLRNPSWLLALDAGATAGWATLAGRGYVPERNQHPFEYGVATGLRVGRTLGRFAVWAEWRGSAWIQGQRATLDGASPSSGADLPQADMSVGLGVSAVLFR